LLRVESCPMGLRDLFRKKRTPPPETPSATEPPVSDDGDVTKHLDFLLRGHGVATERHGPTLVVPGTPYRAEAEIVTDRVHAQAHSIQLDVRLQLSPDRCLIESFGGLGDTRTEAVGDAFSNFARGSLHVLLRSFLVLTSDDEQVTVESWSIDGTPRTVVIGNVLLRGRAPEEVRNPTEWFNVLEAAIRSSPLSPEAHWIRFYYAQSGGQELATEALLDNEPWYSLVESMRAFPWPASEAFYSARLFLVVQAEQSQSIRLWC
jgi:hypothetical protein